ncbi:MAG: GAF domain-containing protein, partial [Bdellovibrionales bacterium]
MALSKRQDIDVSASQIGGYEIVREIGTGATSRVYLARKESQEFALKVMRNDLGGDSINHALRFRKEAETLQRMKHPSLVKIIELGESAGLPFVAMELLQGQELSAWLKTNKFDEASLIEFAIGLAGALAEVHRNGIVHRDIKPDNIFVTPPFHPKLIDFGFAEGHANLRSMSSEAVGTFVYAAPEQSGVLNAPVDATSDLYSLGVVLFQCAAGQPPFASEDVSELLKKHLEEKPPNLRELNPSIGRIFTMIVEKLLAKAPTDRYQTAEGLIADLTDLSTLAEKLKNDGHVLLGQRDFKIGRQNEMPLLGRETEMELLESVVLQGGLDSGSGFLIEGEPGSGKSYLIKKFIDRIADKKGTVLSGKCQIAEQTPLGPLREAVESYLREMQFLPEQDQTERLNNLSSVAKGREIYVRRLSRGIAQRLNLAISEESEQKSISQEEFFSGLAEFFTAFAKIQTRIVLHIDDVQWLDQASLGVLTLIQERLQESPLVLLATARNDPASQDALTRVLSLWSSGRIRKLSLRPLSPESLKEIVRAQLGGHKIDENVDERLATKANGNPFVVSQYVYAKLDARIMHREADHWVVDTARLDDLIVSADVSDLILARMRNLSQETRDVLQLAATIGNKFEDSLVRQVLKNDPLADRALVEASRANLIEQSGADRYAFVHDRILEALLSDLDPERRRTLHQNIAESMDTGTTAVDFYALASHYAQGQRNKLPARAYQTCFEAGEQSLENFANDDALEFLEAAHEIATGPLASSPPTNLLALHQTLGMAYWRKGMGKKAIEHCELVLKLSQEPLIQAQVRAMMTNIYFNENQGSKGWKESELGLRVMGTRFPSNRLLSILLNAYYWAKYRIVAFFQWGFGRATGDELTQRRVLMQLYGPSTFASFVGLRFDVTAQLVPRMLYQLHRLGERLETVPGWAFYSLWLGFHRQGQACLAMAERSIEIAQRAGDNQMIAQARFYAGFGIHWAGLTKQAEEFQRSSLLSFGRWMAPRWYISTANDLAGNNLLVRGLAREALTIADLCQKKAESTRNLSPIAVSKSLALGVYSVLGQEREADKRLKELIEIYQKIPQGSLDWCWFHAHRTLMQLERGELIPEIDTWAENFLKLNVDAKRAPLFFKTMYLYTAHAALQRVIGADAHMQIMAKPFFRKSMSQLKVVAGAMPHWLCHYWALLADFQLHNGKVARAERSLAKAQEYAIAGGSPWGLFMVERSRAHLARLRGNQEVAFKHANKAAQIASENGWGQREGRIRQEFQSEFAAQKARRPTSDGSNTSDEILQRQIETLLAISRVSAQHNGDLQELVNSTLDELVRIFSADRAIIVIKKEDGSSDTFGRDSGARQIQDVKGFSSTVLEKVMLEKTSIIVSGTGEGALIGSESIVAQDLRSIIAAPLLYRQKTLGAIYLDSKMSNGLFTADDRRLLEGVVNQIAVFIEAASNYNKLQALLEVSLASSAVLDPEAQARIALDEIISMMGAQRGLLFLKNDAGNLDLVLARDSQRKDITGIRGYSSTVVNRTLTDLKPILVTGSEEGELIGSKSAVVHDLRSIMAAPLVHKGLAQGVLYLDSQIAKGGFNPEDVRLLTGVANLITIAFVTAKITKLEIERRNLEKNLELTGQVQSLLLPHKINFESEEFSLVGHYQPAEQSGGDWWFFERLHNGSPVIVV